jgi:hypothetical protein
MGHIGDLFKRVDELQKEIDGMKKENQDLKDLIKDKTGVDVDATDNKTDTVDGAPVPKPVTATNKPNCPIKLNVQQGATAGRIMQQLQKRGLNLSQLLNWVEDRFIKDPKFVLEIRRMKKN